MQSGSGKADALNTGISYARKDFVCVVDADSMLENDSLQKIMAPLKKTQEPLRLVGLFVVETSTQWFSIH